MKKVKTSLALGFRVPIVGEVGKLASAFVYEWERLSLL